MSGSADCHDDRYRLLKKTLGQVNEVAVMFACGANDAAQDGVRSGAFWTAVTAIGLVYDHGGAQFPLGKIVGGRNGVNIEEGEDIGALFAQQFGKALDVCLAVAMGTGQN